MLYHNLIHLDYNLYNTHDQGLPQWIVKLLNNVPNEHRYKCAKNPSK